MSAMRDWQEIKELLESDKIKQRSEGISRCREFLSSKRNFKALHDNRNHSWLETLQTLFHIVIIERNASVSKKTAATEKRLDEAAQMVRWLTEKVHRLVPRKIAKAIINHLTQMIAIGGKVQSYALVYAKALRTVISYPPHLEHLDERQWTDIVMLCFSAVLGDKVKIGQDFVDAEAMDVDEDATLGGSLRAGSDDEFAVPSKTKRTANPLEIELVGCIEVAFRSKSSPFITYAQAIFRKFLRFFRLFPSETTAHLAAVVALNRAFGELDLNDQRSMRRLGPNLWPHVLALWSTKNSSLKEQVVMALRYLFPFVIPREHPHRTTAEPIVTTRAKELYEAVLTEPTIRWRDGYTLDIDQLDLGIDSDRSTSTKKAFEGKTFRIGNGFDERNAIAWSVVELGADALARIYEVSEVSVGDGSESMSETARGKRRKIEDPLSILLDTLTDPSQPTNIVNFRLQVLLLLVDCHWKNLESEACRRIFAATVDLLSHTDPFVQRWACLVVAAIAHDGLSEVFDSAEVATPMRRGTAVKSSSNVWDQVWLLALRKISIVEVSRPAAHLANILLAFDRIAASSLTESIELFAKDLEVQGPTFPSDSVCLFLEWILAVCSSDSRLFRLNLTDKVLSWLTTAWRPLEGVIRSHGFNQPRPHADPFSPAGLVHLATRLAGTSRSPSFPRFATVPDCAIGTQALDLCETAKVRDFIEARVPPRTRGDSPNLRTPAAYDLVGGGGGVDETTSTIRRKVSAWFSKTLDGFVREGDLNGDLYWSSMTLELARRHLDLASTALNIEGMFSLGLSDRLDSNAVRSANTVLTRLAPTLALKKWQAHERSCLLNGLDLLFPPLDSESSIDYPVFLAPGAASGIPAASLPESRQPHVRSFDFTSSRYELLRTIWKVPSTRETLEELLSAFRFILGEIAHIESSPPSTGSMSQFPATQASQRLKEIEETQKKDDFGDVKVSSRTAQNGGFGARQRAARACMATCVRAFISGEMATSRANGSVRVQEVVDAIISSQGEDAIVVAEQACLAARSGLVIFGLSQAELILEFIGSELLPSYQYARDERFHLVALRFLECTASIWVPAEGPTEHFGINARQLCAYYANGLRKGVLASWRIRLQFMALLDEYVRIDPSNRYWDVGSVALRSEEGNLVSPSSMIPFMLNDRDFRVRFRSSSSAPALFQLFHDLGLPERSLFDDIRANLTFNLAETEQVLTQILANANIIIVSAARRRAPLDVLLDVAGKNVELREAAIASLAAAAERLGLPSVSTLYLEHARYIAWLPTSRPNLAHLAAGEQIGVDRVQQLPFRAVGFSSLRDARLADFEQTASWYLQSEHTQDAFKTMCDVLKRSPQEGKLLCFAETVGIAVVQHQIALYHDPTIPLSVFRSKLQALAEGAGADDAHLADILITSRSDDIVVEIFLNMFAQVWRQDEAVPSLQQDVRALETFRTLFPVDFAFGSEPPPPHFPPEQSITGVLLFDREYPVLSRSPAVFSIVHKLLAKIHAAPFVLHQQRHLISLALVLSLSHRVVEDPVILAVLCHSFASLLPQVDLVLFVPPMYKWAISCWFAVADKGVKTARTSDLSEHLVRAAHAAEHLRKILGNVEPVKDLVEFLDDSLRRLCQLQEATATEACILWPQTIVDTSSFGTVQVYDALASAFAPTSKFAFVNLLKTRQDVLDSPKRGRIVWRLMQAISKSEKLSSDDCLAFADVLFNAGGVVEVPGLVELGQEQLDTGNAESMIEEETPLKQGILVKVVKLLNDSDSKLVLDAFNTFKLLASVQDAAKFLQIDRFEPDLQAVVSYLAQPSLLRSRYLRPRQSRSLDELERDEWVKKGSTFDQWVCDFAELLADVRSEGDAFYAQLVPLIRTSCSFANTVLPSLFHSILLLACQSKDTIVETSLSRYLERLLRSKSTHFDTISTLVGVATHLRRHPRPDLASSPSSRFDRWLSVPWILLAEGAVRTKEYLTGLLFLELAHEYDSLFARRDGRPYDRRIDEQGQALHYEIYSNLDEPDGFYSRQTDDVRQALVRRLEHEHRWTEAFQAHGARHEASSADLGASSSSSTAGVVASLSSFGFNRLAMSVYQPARLNGSLQEDDLSTELPYELAWRTDVWDLPIEERASKTSGAVLYSALRASRPGRLPGDAVASVRSALVEEVSKLSHVGLDLPRVNPKVVSTVLALREVHRLVNLQEEDDLSPSIVKTLATVPPSLEYTQTEFVLSTRISRLRMLRAQEQVEAVGEVFKSSLHTSASTQERACLIELSKSSRAAGELQAAFNAVTLAHTLLPDDEQSNEIDRELSHVLWARGEHSTAISLLEAVHLQTKKREPTIWATLGEWTGEAHTRNPRQVLDECFDPAVASFNATTSPQDRAEVHRSFASFADAQYQQLVKHTAEKRARYDRYARRKKVEMDEMTRQAHSNGMSGSGGSRELEHAINLSEAHLADDLQQLEESERTTNDMLRRALENYAHALAESETANDKIFRFCALLLGQSDNNDIHTLLKPLLTLIPSHKFVFLSYQLSARLSKPSHPSPFSKNIRRLVLRLCTDHPFHAIFPVHALCKVPSSGKGSRRSSTSAKLNVPKDSRAQAAMDVFEQVKSLENLRHRVESLELACVAYGEWAAYDLRENPSYVDSRKNLRKGSLPIARSMRLKSKVNNLPIPVSTFDLPIDPTGRYDDSTFPHIVKYGDHFDTAGGIHVPKIVTCIGSDGKGYRQLLKGDDEVRQDAVMEQVFVLVNDLLAQDSETRRRKLQIRTYKVIPLQNRNGLLEFVANTAPLGSCLSRLYEQIAPGVTRKARDALGRPERECRSTTKDPVARDRQKISSYKAILKEMPPLMRHLFWQRHKLPSLWYDMRLNYSRSVATTSIIGNVLGLGDRHVSNILMDEATGELVHIDFGVAFDQGKRLPIAELVPFRLTQNLVDGFGSSGVEGVFRRCSEETLRVLRDRSSIVMTILEVFKHDPLQTWAVSSELAKRIQGTDDADALDDLPDDADRALQIIDSKLDTRTSVQYTVNQLIQEATDVDKLAVIFSGWQPYL